MDYLALFAGITALMWSGFQQYKINQMCYTCPFRKGEEPQRNPQKMEIKTE